MPPFLTENAVPGVGVSSKNGLTILQWLVQFGGNILTAGHNTGARPLPAPLDISNQILAGRLG